VIEPHCTNILRAAFSYKSFLGFVIFWQKDFGTKAAYEMLVKLTPVLLQLLFLLPLMLLLLQPLLLLLLRMICCD
jgi:hypothetical protein